MKYYSSSSRDLANSSADILGIVSSISPMSIDTDLCIRKTTFGFWSFSWEKFFDNTGDLSIFLEALETSLGLLYWSCSGSFFNYNEDCAGELCLVLNDFFSVCSTTIGLTLAGAIVIDDCFFGRVATLFFSYLFSSFLRLFCLTSIMWDIFFFSSTFLVLAMPFSNSTICFCLAMCSLLGLASKAFDCDASSSTTGSSLC